jgi:hypothetical protein
VRVCFFFGERALGIDPHRRLKAAPLPEGEEFSDTAFGGVAIIAEFMETNRPGWPIMNVAIS